MVINVSKQFEFSPSLGELVLTAYGRIKVRPAELTPYHMQQARVAANLVLSEWANSTPNLWEVALQTVPLLQGSATYTVPAETVMILDAYISYGTPTTDRIILPISRTEYASYPNKTQQGFPSVFWFDRLISPEVTLWYVPDGNGPYVLKYYSVRQTMDAVLANGLTVEIPYRWMDAYAAALAWRLSEIFMPELEDKMFAKSERAFKIAATQDTENVSLMISPQIGSYFR